MKKVFFTAVALVAFSFNGMANTEEVVLSETSTAEVGRDCNDVAYEALELIDPCGGLSDADAVALSQEIFNACLKSNC